MSNSDKELISLLATIEDPEIPTVNIVELGIVREAIREEGKIRVQITPTYSGCPAIDMIRDQIMATLASAGFHDVELETTHSPPWSTEWLSDETKMKLKAQGIAPPQGASGEDLVSIGGSSQKISCPYCDSNDTKLQSAFSSTACKAMYVCHGCHQPFEYFKEY